MEINTKEVAEAASAAAPLLCIFLLAWPIGIFPCFFVFVPQCLYNNIILPSNSAIYFFFSQDELYFNLICLFGSFCWSPFDQCRGKNH